MTDYQVFSRHEFHNGKEFYNEYYALLSVRLTSFVMHAEWPQMLNIMEI